MADVIKSIRTGGDYTTIAAWEADLDNGAVYSAGDHAIGELYNQNYAEQCTINGGSTIGLSAVTLRANAAHRHKGRPGTGARVTHANQHYFGIASSSIPVSTEFIEFNGQGNLNNDIWNSLSTGTSRIRNCIVWNYQPADSTANCYLVRDRGGGDFEADNNLVFGGLNTGTSRITGILLSDTGTGNRRARNNTVTDISNTNVSGVGAQGINFGDLSGRVVQNNLCTNVTSTAGTAEAFDTPTVTTATTAGNVSDDATSPQSTLRNAVVNFQDAALDVYWPAPSDKKVFGAGTDLGSGQIALDLFGRDRDTKGDTWDAGAFQFVPGIPYFVGGAEESGNSVTSLTVTHGVTIEAGDVIVVAMHSNSVDANLVGDATYTFNRDYIEQNPSAGTGTFAVFTRVATASEPASYTFSTNSTADRNQLSLAVFRNVSRHNPWQIAPSSSVRDWSDAWTTAVAPTITTTTDYAFGMVLFYRDSGTSFENVTNGYTHEVQSLGIDREQALGMWSRLWTPAGATGTTSADLSSSTGAVAYQLALNPATNDPLRVQVGEYDSGGNSVVSATVTLPEPATAGNLLVAVGSVDKTASYNDPPAGWSRIIADNSNAGVSQQYIYKIAAGGETSVTLTPVSVSRSQSALIAEYMNVGTLGVTAQNSQGTPATTCSSGTTASNSNVPALGVSFFGSDSAANVEIGRTYSNGFDEYAFTGEASAGTPGSNLADKVLVASGTVETTFTTTDTGDEMLGAIGVFYTLSGPVITDVDTDETWDDGSTGLVITGTGFV